MVQLNKIKYCDCLNHRQNLMRRSHLLPLSSVPVSLHRTAASLGFDDKDWFVFKEAADVYRCVDGALLHITTRWQSIFSLCGRNGANAALNSLIEWRRSNPILNPLCTAHVVSSGLIVLSPCDLSQILSTPPSLYCIDALVFLNFRTFMFVQAASSEILKSRCRKEIQAPNHSHWTVFYFIFIY